MSVSAVTAIVDPDHFVSYVSGGVPVTVARTLPVVVYGPSAPGTYPVVVFSHGHGGGPGGGTGAIASALADLGYIVIAPTHLDSLVYLPEIRDQFSLELSASSLHRVADMQFALDRAATLAAILPGGYAADMTSVAAIGHSHGAFTAALLAGAAPVDPGYVLSPSNPYGISSLADPRLDAAILLSPQGVTSDWAHLSAQSWDNLSIPILAMTGTFDYETSAIWSSRLDFMRHADSGPLYAVVFDEADHSQLGGRTASPELIASIAGISDKFFDAYLANDLAARNAIGSAAGMLAANPLASSVFERAGVANGGAPNGSGAVRGHDYLDSLVGIQTDDVIHGLDGNDLINGFGGADILFGEGGPDGLIGGPGDDYLYGGEGADILDGGEGGDVLD
ncbi:MAG: hypothetical protein ABL957_13230, partial [Parvularculaceae bacterium]